MTNLSHFGHLRLAGMHCSRICKWISIHDEGFLGKCGFDVQCLIKHASTYSSYQATLPSFSCMCRGYSEKDERACKLCTIWNRHCHCMSSEEGQYNVNSIDDMEQHCVWTCIWQGRYNLQAFDGLNHSFHSHSHRKVTPGTKVCGRPDTVSALENCIRLSSHKIPIIQKSEQIKVTLVYLLANKFTQTFLCMAVTFHSTVHFISVKVFVNIVRS